MLAVRVIPCLDVDAGRVVKGVNFVGIRDAGDPVELAQRYDAEGADELVFLDITASSDARDTMVHTVEQVAEQVFIPFTVGGGVRSVEDVRRLLRAGCRQGLVQHCRRQRSRSRPREPRWSTARSASSSPSTPAGAPKVVGRSSPTAAALRPGSTQSPGPSASAHSARVRSCSPRWTATERKPVTTSRCCRQWARPSTFRSSPAGESARSITSTRAPRPAAPARCSRHRSSISASTLCAKQRPIPGRTRACHTAVNRH